MILYPKSNSQIKTFFMTKISFKREECIGCGNCIDISPLFWKIEPGDGLATLVGAKKHGKYYILEIGEEAVQENQEAEKICPVHVIKLE